MEAKENSQQISIFDNMVIAPKSQKHNFEIHIHSDQSTLAQRNPHVFCKKCGKFGRKDYLKVRHPQDHPYNTAASLAFVCHGEEPNRDKYGEFEQFQKHFGIQQCSQEDKLTLKELEKKDQLDCQRFFWKKEQESDVKICKKNTKEAQAKDLVEIHDNNSGQDSKTPSKRKYKKRGQKSKSTISLIVNNTEMIVEQKTSTKGFKRRGKSCKDKRNKKEFNQMKKSLKLNEQTVNKISKKSKKSIKTLKVSSTKVQKKCTREIKKSKSKNKIKSSSKRIIKQAVKTANLINSQKITANVGKGKKKLDKLSLKQLSKHKWLKIMVKLQVINQRNKTNEIVAYYKQKIKDLIASQNKLIYKTWDDHKHLMLKERAGHVDLYHQKATFDSTKQQLENSEKTVEFQRQQINLFITKLAKYAPSEVKDYPKNLITDGKYDPVIWKLTLEAETDEALIKSLKEKLEEKSAKMESIENENQELKSQIVSATSKIQLMSNAIKLEIMQLQTLWIQPQLCMLTPNHTEDQSDQLGKPADSAQNQSTCLLSVEQEPQIILENKLPIDVPQSVERKAKKVSFCTENEMKDDNLPDKDRHPRTKLILMKQKLLGMYRKKKYQKDLFQKNVKILKTLKIKKPQNSMKEGQSESQESQKGQSDTPVG